MGILSHFMAYYNQSPYNWIVFHPLYTANNQAFIMGILATPPKATPQEIAGLIKGY